MFDPHFLHFVSPCPSDAHLGAAVNWPQLPALLVLDSFPPQLRHQVLEPEQAVAHRRGVWVLQQHENNPDDPSLNIPRRTARFSLGCQEEYGTSQEGDYNFKECWETAD